MSRGINVDKEITELRGFFPDISRGDFGKMDNGNIVTVVEYETEFLVPDFEVLIEYPPSYPSKPPNAYVIEPEIDPDCPHIWDREPDTGVAKICFIKPSKWRSYYTSYEAAGMIKSWIYAYCNWERNGIWDWEEEEH